MLNHARTLLLNQSSSKSPGADFFAEEIVPPRFTALELPTYLQTIRRVLFGTAPDRAMLNYRLRQYLPLLHSVYDLEQFVLNLDTRFTYERTPDSSLFYRDAFRPLVSQYLGAPAGLSFSGTPEPGDATGRVRHLLDVTVTGGDTVQVTRQSAPLSQEFYEYTTEAGLSSSVPLTGTGYAMRFPPGVGRAWSVEVYNRPQASLGQLTATLRYLDAPVLLSLFGLSDLEPYTTFRNLWNDHTELPYQLGGFLLAVIYRTDEVRRGTHA